MRLRRLAPLFLASLGCAWALAATAAVNDVFPGDFYPTQPGRTNVSLYLFDREQQGPYAGGKQQLDGRIDVRLAALRIGHTRKIGDTTLTGVMVLPWSHSEVTPPLLTRAIGERAHGAGDLRLGISSWLINDPDNAHYLALAGMISAPTGSYDNRQLLNIGENRWKYILLAGWQKDITSRLLIELAPELAFYGDNDDYRGQRLEQAPTRSLTSYLRYRLSPAWHVHVGGQINRGGKTRVAGVDRNNPANSQRVTAGMSWYLPGLQQVILRLAKENDVENGFAIRREVALRYQIGF
jgi:hypothetical protein